MPLGIVLFGGVGLSLMLVALLAHPSDPPKPLTLPEAERQALEERVRGRLRALLDKLELPPSSLPEIRIWNGLGRDNMSVIGPRISSKARIDVGEDWDGFTDEEMDGVLAHELGHLHRRDTARRFPSLRNSPRLLGIWGLAVSFAAGMAVWASAGSSRAISDSFWLLEGASRTSAGPALLAAFAAVTFGGALMLLGASRLQERLADRYSARLVGADGMIAFFERLSAKPLTRRQRWQRRLSLVWSTHPRLPTRLRYLRRMRRP